MTLTITRTRNRPAEVAGDIALLPDISAKARLWRRFVPYVSLRLPDHTTVQLGRLEGSSRLVRRNLSRCAWAQPQPLPTALRGKIRRRNHR